MLKLLFPASVEEITRKAAEQREAAILSGRATASDVAAGLALGKSIADARHQPRARRRHGHGRRQRRDVEVAVRCRHGEGRGRVAEPGDRRRARRCCMNFGTVKAWTMTPAEVAALRARAAAVDLVGSR